MAGVRRVPGEDEPRNPRGGARAQLTAGIDLASQARETAACRIAWPAGERGVVQPPQAPCGQGRLLAPCRAGAPVGIDAPFGWPVAFVEAVSAWGGGGGAWRPGAWPEKPAAQRSYLRALRLRGTDRFVWAHTGRTPLSVSTDTIAIPAMRCVALL